MNRVLRGEIVKVAHTRRRFGYRRIHDLLQPELQDMITISESTGFTKRLIWRFASVPRRSGQRMNVCPCQSASMVNEAWNMDFVSDSLVNGRRLKCLTVAVNCSHECNDITVEYGISRQYVTKLLDQAAIFRGYPKIVRTDNVPEFILTPWRRNYNEVRPHGPIGQIPPARSAEIQRRLIAEVFQHHNTENIQ